MTSERWREIEELYHAVQRRAPSERGAFLAEACHGDAELKAQIDGLLAQDSGGKILDGPAAELLTGAVDHAHALSLSAGDKLGPYEISGLIGAGGMGEVYRARDPRLNRDVAIKVSQERFSDRFQREARAVAALNHPNICTLHDVGPNYLVMELIDGKSPKGPLPLEEVLRIARQIAAALEAAHEKGIVHRDLKPLNIKIKPDGSVKVLDFGLAKAIQTPSGNPQDSPTEALSLTRAGTILGTAAYMSPEQARGKTVDKRADIWAFGLVLHELITGRVLFQGDDITETLAAVVKQTPDLSDVPERVRPLLEKCLEKDPRKRLRDIGDFELLLEPRAKRIDSRRAPWMPWLVAALFAGVAAWAWVHTTVPPPRPVTRWTIPLTSPQTNIWSVALSRDGTRLAYVTSEGNLPHIMLRMMDQFEAKPIPGSEGGFYPLFSPDGQWLVYISGPRPFKIKKIPVTGGTPITLCDGEYYPSSWGDDDTILLGGASGRGLLRISASGGVPQTLTTPDAKKGEMAHWRPRLVPGGQAVLFTIVTGIDYDNARIAVLDLKKGTYRVLGQEGTDARYVSTGHLLYARGGTLYGVLFDLKRMAAIGAETPVVENVALNGLPNTADYALADSGVLVYRPGVSPDTPRALTWADRKGIKQSLNVPPQNYRVPRVSPDGQRAAIEIHEGHARIGSGKSDIWVVEPARGTSIRLTSEGANVYPIWTRDGRRVTFMSMLRGADSGIYWAPADGSGKPELLLATGTLAISTAWTADGDTLFYHQPGPDGKFHIWILPVPGAGGDNKPRPFLGNSFNEGFMVASPDGRWVAYQSDETGRFEIYVRPFPGPGGKTRISTQGGYGPRWYGREIFYRTPVSELAAVDVQTSPTFHAGPPQILFKPMSADRWDVAPDGKRILLVEEPKAPTEGARLEVVTDWFEELRRRVPVSGK